MCSARPAAMPARPSAMSPCPARSRLRSRLSSPSSRRTAPALGAAASVLLFPAAPLLQHDGGLEQGYAARGMGDPAGFEHLDSGLEGHPMRRENIFLCSRHRIKCELFGEEDMIDAGNDRRERLDTAERRQYLRPIAGL